VATDWRKSVTQAAVLLAILSGGLAAICLLVSLFLPTTGVDGIPYLQYIAWKPPGHHCRLCGMTRAFVAISHGHVEVGKGLNGLALPTYAGFVVLVILGLLLTGFVCFNRPLSWRSLKRQRSASQGGKLGVAENVHLR